MPVPPPVSPVPKRLTKAASLTTTMMTCLLQQKSRGIFSFSTLETLQKYVYSLFHHALEYKVHSVFRKILLPVILICHLVLSYSQKKPQRVALLFEDEGDDDEDKGSLFGIKPAVNTNTAAAASKVSVLIFCILHLLF